jgi:hypothetical protein
MQSIKPHVHSFIAWVKKASSLSENEGKTLLLINFIASSLLNQFIYLMVFLPQLLSQCSQKDVQEMELKE